jgi:hypothetical protein
LCLFRSVPFPLAGCKHGLHKQKSNSLNYTGAYSYVLRQNSFNVPIPHIQHVAAQTSHDLHTFFKTHRNHFNIITSPTQFRPALDATLTTHHRPTVLPPLDRSNVYALKRHLQPFTISPADRNPGCLYITCPLKYDLDHFTAFDEFGDTYEPLKQSEKQHLKDRRSQYFTNGFDSVAKWNPNGSLPYSYITYKFKDDNRTRPIVSCCAEPDAQFSHLAAKALNFLVECLDAQIGSFTLWNSKDLAEKVHNFQQSKSTANPATEFLYSFSDIKEMFTRLPHDVLRIVLAWITSPQPNFPTTTRPSTRTRNRTRLCIARHGTRGVRFGRSFNKHDYAEMELSTLQHYLLLNLPCTFNRGSTQLTQIKGIAMGKCPSPPTAGALCLYAE